MCAVWKTEVVEGTVEKHSLGRTAEFELDSRLRVRLHRFTPMPQTVLNNLLQI